MNLRLGNQVADVMSSCSASASFVLANHNPEIPLECGVGQRGIDLENQRLNFSAAAHHHSPSQGTGLCTSSALDLLHLRQKQVFGRDIVGEVAPPVFTHQPPPALHVFGREIVGEVTPPIFAPAIIPASSGLAFSFSLPSGTSQPVHFFGPFAASCSPATFGGPALGHNSAWTPAPLPAAPPKDTSIFEIKSSSSLQELEAFPSKSHIVSIDDGKLSCTTKINAADTIVRVMPQLTALSKLELRNCNLSASDTVRICGAAAAAGLRIRLVMYSNATCDEVASSEAWQSLPFPPPPKHTKMRNIPINWPAKYAGRGNMSYPEVQWGDMIAAMTHHAIVCHACISIQCSRRLSLASIDPCISPPAPLLMPHVLSQKQRSRLISFGGLSLCILRKMAAARAGQPRCTDRIVARLFSSLVRLLGCSLCCCFDFFMQLTLHMQVRRLKGQAAAVFNIPNVTDRWDVTGRTMPLPPMTLWKNQQPECRARNVWPVLQQPSLLYGAPPCPN
jgi:hypothetical protein